MSFILRTFNRSNPTVTRGPFASVNSFFFRFFTSTTPSQKSVPPMSKGLAGVMAGETAISTVGVEGTGLNYRGYSIESLADQCTKFEEVAYLLLVGKLPNAKELNDFTQRIVANRQLPTALKLILEQLPASAHPMDVLRTGCSALGSIEPELLPHGKTQYDESIQLETSIRLFGLFSGILLYWHHFHVSGIRIETATSASSIAEHFFQLLFANRPDVFEALPPDVLRALNVSLILYADHDFNASTFASRVTAATLSDLHSSVTTAIGTLKGPLHGGASEAAMELLNSVDSEVSADRKLSEMVRNKQLVMGFGHRIYKHGDPRSDLIKVWAKRLSELPNGNLKLFKLAEYIQMWMLNKKGMYPNLDFYTAVVYDMSGIPMYLFTPIFAISRTAGWTAHIFEQRSNNRLIRPSGLYVGPSPRPFVPIAEREGKVEETPVVSRM